MVAALIATESAVILKAVGDLVVGNDTPEEDEQDYDKIGGSTLTIAVTLVMMLLGEIAADLAKSVWESVSGLFRGERAPEIEVRADAESAGARAEGPGDTTGAAENAGPEVRPQDAPPDSPAGDRASDAGTEDRAPESNAQERVAAERTTPDGHTIKVLEDGRCLSCTTCEELNFRYQDELRASENLRQKWTEANADADPNVKAEKIEQLKAELDDARTETRAGETPEQKVQALESMRDRAERALAELRDALDTKDSVLNEGHGALRGEAKASLADLQRRFNQAAEDVTAVQRDAELHGLPDDARQQLEDIGWEAREPKDRINEAVSDQAPTDSATPAGDQPARPIDQHIADIISGLSEDEQNQLLSRIRRGDAKGRAFGTPRNPRMPTVEEFNPRIQEVRAGDLEGSGSIPDTGLRPISRPRLAE